MTITRSQMTKTTERKKPAGKGTYGSNKNRPKKRRQSPYANTIGKGKPSGELIKKKQGNQF